MEEPMNLGKTVLPAESEAEIESEGVRRTISGGKMANDIENQLQSKELFHLSRKRCIYRVPKRLRQVNEKAYTPQVVSIGPLHHGKEHLKAMEEHKERYLQAFLSRTRLSFDNYIKEIKDQGEELRRFYAESIVFDSDQFARIVLVDAAFVIELLLRYYFMQNKVADDYCQGEDDYIFNNPMMLWDLRPDLRLLENQLPFFILQYLFNTLLSSSHQLPSLLQISYDFVEGYIDGKGKKKNFEKICLSGEKVQHFVDLIRILYQPLKSKTRLSFETTATPNVTELLQAGVKFEVRTDTDLFDIKFSRGILHWILEIPKLTVDDSTDLTFRNLLAFEQCHHREEDYLSNYIFLMKRLAKTSKDVELLVEEEIIENWLGDTQKISTLLQDLDTGLIVDQNYYATLCNDLIKYRRKFWRKWMVYLKQNYCNTPWSAISVVAAGILLILTIIQTVCSYKSVPLL